MLVFQQAGRLADVFSVLQGSTLFEATGILFNDIDADNDPLVAILLSGPSNGSLSFAVDGKFTYIPDAGFVGIDSFRYVASDGVTAGLPTDVQVIVAVGSGGGPTTGPGNTGLNGNPSGGGSVPPTTDNSDSEDDRDDSEIGPTNQVDLRELLRSIGEIQRVSQTKTSGSLGDTDPADAGFVDGNTRELNELSNASLQNAALHLLCQLAATLGDGNFDLKSHEFGFGGNSGQLIFNLNKIWQQLASIEGELREQQERTGGFEIQGVHFDLGTITLAASMGYVIWMLRGGVMMAALLTQLPTWKMIDPLIVMDSYAFTKSESSTDELNSYFEG